ncbi:MAG: MiaB/RimO family radical SAM methylthiotransferase [Elusimicrobia bacterium]|nr:MiaB/RimO family radical SAM methylthiotransferase [Elusimicrobiota bacterium]
MRVHAITLGCQMSAADGARIMDELGRRGLTPAPDPDSADAVVLTTCAVRAHAEQRALSLIGRLGAWRRADARRLLVVAGCVAERRGQGLIRRFPHVDLVIGARQADRYAELIYEAVTAKNMCRASPEIGGTPSEARHIGARLQTSLQRSPEKPGTYSSRPLANICGNIIIMRGCDCRCAYCVVPLVRGPEVCRPPRDIVAEARAKTAAGARELTLLGQRVNAYSWEEGGRRTDFADLLRELDAVPGLLRLRFMSPHPDRLDERVLDALAECARPAPFIHLPAQSGCDRILRLMRRGYTRAQFLRAADRLRRRVPGVVLSTDIIVGFSTETDAEFRESLELLTELRPATTFAFKYSAREGTPAAELEDDVPRETKERRLAELNGLVEELTLTALRTQVGKTVEVLAETPTFGRTGDGFKVKWANPARPGSLVRVRVRGATRRTLLGDSHEP